MSLRPLLPALALVAAFLSVPAAVQAEAATCQPGPISVSGAMAASDWAPVTPAKWQFPGDEVILAQAGVARPGPRRPFEYAVLTAGPVVGSVEVEAEVRLDTPVTVSNRDVIIVFGYRSDTEFYYVHLSQDNTIYPHNGIFVVNKADRLRIDHQWNGQVGAPPAVTDANWHKVLVRHCAGTGEISVFMDGATTPLMTAKDRTFGWGRTGFGSFDNIGRTRDFQVRGTPVCGGESATMSGTDGPDLLTGTGGRDVIAGLGGKDLIRAVEGDDVVCGGDGDDLLLGGEGNDILYGGAGSDLLNGGPGDDTLHGAPSQDLLIGGPGSDAVQDEVS